MHHEVDAAGRSKASLIVGIDFGTTFSGVAFAFATNNEAREDIITEWPGAGTHTKQKVGLSLPLTPHHFWRGSICQKGHLNHEAYLITLRYPLSYTMISTRRW